MLVVLAAVSKIDKKVRHGILGVLFNKSMSLNVNPFLTVKLSFIVFSLIFFSLKWF